jgi:hypothetical protein
LPQYIFQGFTLPKWLYPGTEGSRVFGPYLKRVLRPAGQGIKFLINPGTAAFGKYYTASYTGTAVSRYEFVMVNAYADGIQSGLEGQGALYYSFFI